MTDLQNIYLKVSFLCRDPLLSRCCVNISQTAIHLIYIHS